jgi:hypothetical protein
MEKPAAWAKDFLLFSGGSAMAITNSLNYCPETYLFPRTSSA